MSNVPKVVSVGASQDSDSESCARQAAAAARAGLASGTSPGWALAFCGGRLDPDLVMQGLRSQLGEIDIVGGSAIGTITNDWLAYTGNECAVAVFSDSQPGPTILTADNLSRNEHEAGCDLGKRLSQAARPGATALLFYDSVRQGPPPVLNLGSTLLDGLYQGLDGQPMSLVGAGLLGDHEFTGSYAFIFNGRQAVKDAALAILLPAGLQCHSIIMHGCIPISSFMEITRIEGAVLYELDGLPALPLVQDKAGPGNHSIADSDLFLRVTIGQKHGDPFADYDESVYVNRLIVSSNPAEGSVTLFEGGFKAGSQVQLMLRDNQMMMDSVQKRSRELLTSLGDRIPIAAFYVDCGGRSAAFSGSEEEEAGVLQAELGPEIPLLGFYSGVEIGPLLGHSRALAWTGVLSLFTLNGS